MAPTASTSNHPPPFFTWVIPDKLAACGLPRSPKHIQYLWDVGIRHLVSLTAEFQPPMQAAPNMNLVKMNIIDFHPPTMQQIEEFLDLVEQVNAKGEVSNCFVYVSCLSSRLIIRILKQMKLIWTYIL